MEISIQIPADLHKLFAEKADIHTKKGYPTRVAALWAAIYIENYTTQLQERNECLIEMFGNDLLNNYEAVELLAEKLANQRMLGRAKQLVEETERNLNKPKKQVTKKDIKDSIIAVSRYKYIDRSDVKDIQW